MLIFVLTAPFNAGLAFEVVVLFSYALCILLSLLPSIFSSAPLKCGRYLANLRLSYMERTHIVFLRGKSPEGDFMPILIAFIY